MSDTTVTTAPPAPVSVPQAPVTETPIVDAGNNASPNPITNTPPDKPPMSRRDAIKAAFDRATAQQDGKAPPAKDAKPQAKPAKAEPGHNNPPEETKAEAPKLNLRKRPSEQDAKALENTAPQPRDRGRFAPRQAETSDTNSGELTSDQKPSQQQQQQQQAKPKVNPLPENAPFRDAPARMTEAAKADWHAAPETVRGDVHRVMGEFENAYRGYRAIADAYKPIARFDQMAREHGTTLERALESYTSMEQKLRADVIGGLDVIVNNLNMRAADGKPIGLRDIAYHVLSQSPEQLKQVQMGNAQQAHNSQIGALHQEIQGLKEHINALHNQTQFVQTRSQVDQFADSHPRFDELGAEIERELQLGFDLETAYRRAELLKPATTAAQTRDTAPQTRTVADKSISGAPAGASAPSERPAARREANGKPTGRREAIANAIKRVNGGL
jgi:hypothetical protein